MSIRGAGLLMLLGGCVPRTPLVADTGLNVVRELVSAFNNHDPSAMGEVVSDDVTWGYVGRTSVVVESEGREALLEGMTSYFEAYPDVRSEIVS